MTRRSHPRPRPAGQAGQTGQAGQASVEYLGVLIAAALLVVAILSTPLPATLARAVGHAVCQVTATSGCTVSDPTTTPAHPAAPSRPAAPAPLAAPAPPVDARHAQQGATNTAAATSDSRPCLVDVDYRPGASPCPTVPPGAYFVPGDPEYPPPPSALEQALTGALNGAVSVAGDVIGVTDARQAGEKFAHGDILGGLFHTALAIPLLKPLKAAEEGVRGAKAGLHALEGGEKAAGKEAAHEGAKQAAKTAAETATRDWHRYRKSRGGASRKLAKNLEDAEIPRPKGYVAHHIAVVGAYGNRATAREVRRVQNKLASLGIGPNDVANGVYLPAKFHSPLHTNAYLRKVDTALRTVQTPKRARETLRDISDELKDCAHNPANCKFPH